MNDKKRNPWKCVDAYCVISYVMKRFWMVILTMLIFVMGVYLAQSLFNTPTYSSSVTFSVTTKRANASASVNSVAVTDSVAKQFGELLKSDIVRNAAAERLGLNAFPAEISISVPSNTNIIRMTVTAASPEIAYKSALALIDCHGEYSSAIFSTAVLSSINGPSISTTPSNLPSRQQLLLLSAPIGGICMIALLVLMSLQTDTIQTPYGAKRQIDGKHLSTIFHERKRNSLKNRIRGKKTSLLISNPTCSFYYTETIHQLRIQLEHAKDRNGRKIFLVCSCSENEGKSTVAANLALSLAQKHQKVLLVDADLRKPSQSLIFEENDCQKADATVFIGKRFLKETLMDAIQYSAASNLHTLYFSAASRRRLETLTPDSFAPLMDALREEFSYVIVDTPPIGLFADTDALADVVDASVLVVRQNVASAIAVNDAIDNLMDAHSEFLGYVLNNFRSFRLFSFMKSCYGYGYGYGYGSYDRYGYGNSKKRRNKGGA